MVKSSILINLDDPRTAKIADVISNKTTKKILSLLAESELSQTDLSKALGIPLNTIEYNINKLEEAGLIEKTKDFFWSAKGKRIHRFKVSNKTITISPKSMIRGIIPAVITTAILAFLIKIFLGSPTSQSNELRALATPAAEKSFDAALEAGGTTASAGATETAGNISSQLTSAISSNQNAWLWFILGSLSALFIFLVWNVIRNRQK